MDTLTWDHLLRLKAALSRGVSLKESIPSCLGGTVLGGGCWRVFSDLHPHCGVRCWNEEWCAAWEIPAASIFTFGEDVFGNQLVVTADEKTVYVCDHENGSCFDLQLDVVDALESVLKHGLEWVDFYSNGSLDVARPLAAGVTWEQQLHWTHPLILGGGVEPSNVTTVGRSAHLSGHVQLWKQISGLPPGTEVQLR